MPDTLNKQSIINLLIDSPLREPIKINLIDIVNNTSEADLPKVYSTITKELEIFQKATERRMKLADETIAKLSGVALPESAPATQDMPPAPMPESPAPVPTPASTPEPTMTQPSPLPPQPTVGEQPLTATPLDLPPVDQMPKLDGVPSMSESPANPQAPVAQQATMPSPQPLGTPPVGNTSDEDALAEIQKELDSLKNEAVSDIASSAQTPASPTPPVEPAVTQ